MARLWRIALWRVTVLVLAVMPLAMPVVCRAASLHCKTQMTMEHACCSPYAAVAAPSCCNATADAAITEGRNAAEEGRVITASQASAPMVLDKLVDAGVLRASQAVSAFILLPRLILRT